MADKGLVAELLQQKGLSLRDVDLRSAKIPVRTKVEDETIEDVVDTELPFSLADAVLKYGEMEVFKRFINAQVVYEQGLKRAEMQRKNSGSTATRTRAPYMEALDL